jgi:hypothetical protein
MMRQMITRALLLLVCVSAGAQEIVATPTKAAGVYEIGEKIGWTVALKGDAVADVKQLMYVIKKGGLTRTRCWWS